MLNLRIYYRRCLEHIEPDKVNDVLDHMTFDPKILLFGDRFATRSENPARRQKRSYHA